MKNWRTSVAGAVAACALTGFADLGLPAPWPKLLLLLCAASLAALGYHATDCARCPGNGARLAALGLCLTLIAAVAGCTLSKLGLQVGSPAFGTLKLTVGGGSIGKGGTNTPPEETDAPTGTQGATNALPVASGK